MKTFVSLFFFVFSTLIWSQNEDFVRDSPSMKFVKNDSTKAFQIIPLFNVDATISKKNAYFIAYGVHLQYRHKKTVLGANYQRTHFELTDFLDNYTQNSTPVLGEKPFYRVYFLHRFSKHFQLSAGRDQHRFGGGIRSLVLSRNTPAFWHAKLQTKIWKFTYHNLYAKLSDGGKTKFATFHHLQFKPAKKWRFGLFESVIWGGKDSTINRGFDVHYLHPLIFYRPVEYAQGSSDNVLIGGDFQYKPLENLAVYGQLVLDEFSLKNLSKKWWANKYAIQLGIKWQHDFNHQNQLTLNYEYNFVRPFTYAHISTKQTYSNQFQPLAHPLGANFIEHIARLEFQRKKWHIALTLNYFQKGHDTPNQNFGGNIFKSYNTRNKNYNINTLQGNLTTTHRLQLNASYTLVKRLNLRAFSNVLLRRENTASKLYVSFGIRSLFWEGFFGV